MRYLINGRIIQRGNTFSGSTSIIEDKIIKIELVQKDGTKWKMMHYTKQNPRREPKTGRDTEMYGYMFADLKHEYYGLSGMHSTLGETLCRSMHSGDIFFDDVLVSIETLIS